MRSSFIQVHSFSHPTDFIVLRLRFDEEGIRYYVENELFLQTDLLSNAVGGMPLKVHPEDVERSRQLLFESKAIVPNEERNNTPTLLDMIAMNIKHTTSRWPTILAMILIIASAVGLLSWILLQLN